MSTQSVFCSSLTQQYVSIQPKIWIHSGLMRQNGPRSPSTPMLTQTKKEEVITFKEMKEISSDLLTAQIDSPLTGPPY